MGRSESLSVGFLDGSELFEPGSQRLVLRARGGRKHKKGLGSLANRLLTKGVVAPEGAWLTVNCIRLPVAETVRVKIQDRAKGPVCVSSAPKAAKA